MSPELAATLKRIQALGKTLQPDERTQMPPAQKTAEAAPRVSHVANTDGVKRHFLAAYPDRPDLAKTCDTILGCSLLESEDVLLNEIHEALREKNSERVEEARALLHAVSWMRHKPAPKDTNKLAHLAQQALAHSRELLDHLAAERAVYARTDPQEAGEVYAARAEDVNTILQAIEHNLSGEDAEAAARAIEDFVDDARRTLTYNIGKGRAVNWKDVSAHPEKYREQRALFEALQNLRLVRDQIYYQRLYPDWFTKRQEPPHATP